MTKNGLNLGTYCLRSFSAMVPGNIEIDMLKDFDLNKGSCGCKIENVRKGEFPLNFTLDHYYNETEKSQFLSRRKKDLKQFYQRNYFDQLGKNGQIITKPMQHIQFTSHGLKMAPDEHLNLGLKIINFNENNLGLFNRIIYNAVFEYVFSGYQAKIFIWDIFILVNYYHSRNRISKVWRRSRAYGENNPSKC